MKNSSFFKTLLAASALLIGLSACKPTEKLSSEAEITSFTFDTSIEANLIVTTVPVVNSVDGTIAFNVKADATDDQLAALVPTITVSEGATVDPASGSTVDFSQSIVTFTVTAQDKSTTRIYSATVTRDEPEEPQEPDTYPMDVLEGNYLGKPTIKVGDLDIPGNLYKKVSVTAVDDSTISLSMKNFVITLGGNRISVGDINIDKCAMGSDGKHYTFSGTQDLTIEALGDMTMKATVNGSFAEISEKMFIKIDVALVSTDGALTVNVAYTGQILTGTESSEAKILTFTFDKSKEANSIVTSDPDINEDESTITFNVKADATDAQLAALVPTITYSEKAHVDPAPGSTVDFKNPVIYTVVAQNGTERTYTVTAVKASQE